VLLPKPKEVVEKVPVPKACRRGIPSVVPKQKLSVVVGKTRVNPHLEVTKVDVGHTAMIVVKADFHD